MDIGAITTTTTIPQVRPIRAEEHAPRGGGFGDLLTGVLDEANQTSQRSDALAESMAKGEPTDIHSVMMAMTEADLSFRMLLEVRNKLIEAYQEIQRIPV